MVKKRGRSKSYIDLTVDGAGVAGAAVTAPADDLSPSTLVATYTETEKQDNEIITLVI